MKISCEPGATAESKNHSWSGQCPGVNHSWPQKSKIRAEHRAQRQKKIKQGQSSEKDGKAEGSGIGMANRSAVWSWASEPPSKRLCPLLQNSTKRGYRNASSRTQFQTHWISISWGLDPGIHILTCSLMLLRLSKVWEPQIIHTASEIDWKPPGSTWCPGSILTGGYAGPASKF